MRLRFIQFFYPMQMNEGRRPHHPLPLSLRSVVLIIIALLIVQGCATPVRRAAVPQALTLKAEIPGLPDIRYRMGNPDDLAAMARASGETLQRELAYRAKTGQDGPLPPAVYLAVSGGGDNGAFGAGLLNGWTAAGNRPPFKLVTGVSTGALIAPFAFLGSEYDSKLKDFYTGVSPKDILEPRSLFAAITSDAMADNRPLWKRVEKEVNQELLDAIAAEWEKGRILLVGTVDLDARQGIIWNMTKLAATRDPRALPLFRSILIASAAIPGAFPPVMIDVEVDGQPYQEMHVDGGTLAQVFVYPPSLKVGELARAQGIERERRLYVIRNARLDPDWAQVERRTMTIAGRAVSALLHSQGVGDLYRIYQIAQRDAVDYNLAYIPTTFKAPHKEEFDTEYMRALFAVGYDMAAKGYPWQKAPPGWTADSATTRTTLKTPQ
jgi:predicted acylesterase/phospholipase RssA